MTYAAAMSEARRLKATMGRWGVLCSIELRGGRGPDPWAMPKKWLRMHHHVASRYVPRGNLTPALGLVGNGRSDLVGPLANGYGGFDRVYRIITMGLANHSGKGGPITIDGVYVPKDSGRGPTWGTEFEGGFQDWHDIPGMLEFMGRADCALAEWSGRPITSQLEHSTWTKRKVDRKNFTRATGIALSRLYTPKQPPLPPTNKDWFDMATQADLTKAISAKIGSLLVKVQDDTSGAVFVLSKATATRTWVDDMKTMAMWSFLGVDTAEGQPFTLGVEQLKGIPILNLADLEASLRKRGVLKAGESYKYK